MASKVSAYKFVAFLKWCVENQCGYIFGATGQNPRLWPVNSHWFTQYQGEKSMALDQVIATTTSWLMMGLGK